MKLRSKVVAFGALSMLLVGCGSGESTKTLECDLKADATTSKAIVSFSGKKVTNIETKYTSDLSKAGLGDKEMDEMKKTVELSGKMYKDMKGVTYAVNLKNKKLTVEMDMDVEKMADKDLDMFGGKDAKDFEATKKKLESSGYTCK